MDDTVARPTLRPAGERAAWLATAVWTALGVVLWIMFPMTASVLLPACTIAPLAWYGLAERRLPFYRPSLVTAWLGVAAVYLGVNASWSLSPTDAARTVILVFLMVATLQVVFNALPDLAEAPLQAMAVGALAGVTAGSALLCFEVLTDQLLRRLLIHLVPALEPRPQHVAMAGGRLMLAPYLPNPNVSVLTLLFWPAALTANRLGLMRARKHLALVLLGSAIVVATVYASEHATSQLAFLGAAATFLLFRMRPKLALPLVIAGWMAMNLLVVPVVSVLYSAEAYRVPWLPDSARHRVVIWGYTSGLIPKAPMFGAGISTGRALNEAADAVDTPVVPGTRYHLAPGLHSHNAYLQVWYETGAVGAFILLGLGLIVLRSLSGFPAPIAPYLVATFVACALSVATAFAIWAPWFMASLAMAAIFARAGAVLPERAARSASPTG
ncbi:MAG: O-antigen ligase family protein [Hyphomicrobiaceae bacterium]|nr:O-antigen ligase family protein [Hyphomicrobiaceae bacterium]